MTDDQVLAKVRAAATRALENMTCLCVGEGGRTPVATCKHCHGSGYLVTDETICARVALAMVDEYTAQRDEVRRLEEAFARRPSLRTDRAAAWKLRAHRDAMARLEAALRTAVASE